MTQRQAIARSAAQRLSDTIARERLAKTPAIVGFDGFIDSIIRAVDVRHTMTADGYVALRTIRAFADRIAAAAGLSTNIELVVKEERFGGNGPLMAGGLGRFGLPVTYIGGIGLPENPSILHPIYTPLAERCRRVIPLAPPARTDALEFDDGKIMLGKPGNLQGITWDLLKRTIGLDTLSAMLTEARLLAMVNWVMMGGVQGIWEGLCEEVLPRLQPQARPRIYIDLCDPAKRTDGDIRAALAALARLNQLTQVTLGMNLAEAVRIDAVLGAGGFTGPVEEGSAIARAAALIRERSGLDTVVIHPRHGAAASSRHEGPSWFTGPLVTRPRLSTGAGDHFNAGFAAAQVAGLPLEECLSFGCAASGCYVRDAESPTLDRVLELLQDMPMPEQDDHGSA
jgi:sugar/nucleoside kinase (ribokinase family)